MFEMTPQQIIDLERMRNIDPALRASMVARLDALREAVKHGCP
jgi:hypothetical protein